MSANKIDDLIENIINDFYTNIIKDNKELKKIYSETNFIKSQKIINDILDNYFKTIPDDIYKQIVKNENSIIYIQETIKRYITIYLFLTIGMNYKSNAETFINNIIEIIRNQKDYSFKVDNLFNADGSSAESCLNGVRCVAYYLFKVRQFPTDFSILVKYIFSYLSKNI
jgi:hypothetical protein